MSHLIARRPGALPLTWQGEIFVLGGAGRRGAVHAARAGRIAAGSDPYR